MAIPIGMVILNLVCIARWARHRGEDRLPAALARACIFHRHPAPPHFAPPAAAAGPGQLCGTASTASDATNIGTRWDAPETITPCSGIHYVPCSN